MENPDEIQIAADIEQDEEQGEANANPPDGLVSDGVYLRTNANGNGQKNADPGVGDKTPHERNSKEDDWKGFQKVQPKFYLDKDWDVHYGDD